MTSIVLNDIFDELKCEINRLNVDLCYERQVNKILEDIKNNSILMKNNCNCIENIDIFKKINDLEIEYKLLKTQRLVNKTTVAVNTNNSKPIFKNNSQLIVSENDTDLDTTSNTTVLKTVITAIEWKPSDNESENVDKTAGTSDQKNLICDECKQVFDTELDLILHVNRNHKNVESYICHECQEVFNSKKDFSVHLSEHQKSKDKPQKANDMKSGTTIDYLRSYRKSPNSLLVSSSSGTGSSSKTNSKFNFVSHLLKPTTSTEQIKDEPQLDEFECNECKNLFHTYCDFEDHIKQNHSSLVCQQCKQWFNSKEDIKIHYRTVHRIPLKIFSCDSCNFTSLSNISLNNHIKHKHMEPDDKEMTAPEENNDTTQNEDNNEMTAPEEYNVAKPAEDKEMTVPEVEENRCNNRNCESFGKKFASIYSLRRHLKICLKRNKSEVESAPRTVSNRLSNMVLKNTEGVFCCEYCEYKTRKISHYKRHRDSVHNKSRDHFVFCNINGCKKIFSRKDILLSHQNKYHSDVNLMDRLHQTTADTNVSSDKVPIVDQIGAVLPDIPAEEEVKLEFISDSDNESDILETKSLIGLENINISKNKSNLSNRLRMHFTKRQTNKPNVANHSRRSIPGQFICDFPGCGRTFSQSRYISDHKRRVHSERKNKSLGSVLTPDTTLSQLNNESPIVAKPYPCDVDDCQYSASRRDTLVKHKRAIHKINQNFVCNYHKCRRRFETQLLLRQHMNCHKNKSLGSVVTPDTTLYKPNNSHSSNESPTVSKPYACDIGDCQYSSIKRENLLKHKRRVHKSNRNFVCNYPNCRRRFDTRLLLRQHMNRHKNRFVCKWNGCEFRTNTFAKLNEHKRLEKHLKQELYGI